MTLLKEHRSRVSACSLLWSMALVSQWATAAPVVQQVSGKLDNKATVTVTGSGFGTKATAAPALWDDGSGTSLSQKWDMTVPNQASNTAYNIQYRAVGYRGVAGPHANSQKYIVGGHTGSWSPYAGGNVMLLKGKSSHAQGDIYYSRTYYRVDPSWQFGAVLDDNNHKWWVTNFGGNGPYEDDEFYIDYDQGKFNNSTSAVQHKYSPAPAHPLRSPDNNGHSNWWNTSANPASKWVLYEVEFKLSTGTDGYLKVWADGVLVMNYAGPTDSGAHQNLSMGFGGYSSTYVLSPTNNFRYFADVYMDFTAARVVLANNANLSNATIIEPQIPSRWTDGSIDVVVNQGKFTTGQTAYLFVVDKNGARSSAGLPVTIGGSGTVMVLPNPPTSVSAS
jgi:hypothetical protein